MANRSASERNVRSLMRNKGGTYLLSLPIEFVKQVKWREKQKLRLTVKGKSLHPILIVVLSGELMIKDSEGKSIGLHPASFYWVTTHTVTKISNTDKSRAQCKLFEIKL